MATTVPDSHRDLFGQAALGHVAYTSDRGRLIVFPMWVDLDGSRLLTSSPVGSRKGAALRARPEIGLSIVSPSDPWHWLSISGRVVGIRADDDLAFIDRMARRYMGTDYPRRTPREVFEIEVERVTASGQ